MEYALLTHDFSVGYVADVGSRETPGVGDDRLAMVAARGIDPPLGIHPRAVRAAFAWRLGDRFKETRRGRSR
jgi:hypothetical protein